MNRTSIMNTKNQQIGCGEWIVSCVSWVFPFCIHRSSKDERMKKINRTNKFIEICDDLLVLKATRYHSTYERLKQIMSVPGMRAWHLEEHFLQGGQFHDDSVFLFAGISPIKKVQ